MKLLTANRSGARRHARESSRSDVRGARDRADEWPVFGTVLRCPPELRPGDVPPRRILVPILDSVSSMPAARYLAREFVNGERMEVHLLHVRTPLSLRAAFSTSDGDHAAYHRRAAEKMLRPVRDLLDTFHIRYAVHFKLGDRAPVIVEMARRLDVDRIVVGAARDNSLIWLVEEPVIEKLIDFAPVPVDVVATRSASQLERIGIPVGLGTALGLLCIPLID